MNVADSTIVVAERYYYSLYKQNNYCEQPKYTAPQLFDILKKVMNNWKALREKLLPYSRAELAD